jgi:diguanylate cyclase (GGDEF)-like protein
LRAASGRVVPIDTSGEVRVLGRGAAKWIGTARSQVLRWPVWSLPPVTRFLVIAVPAVAAATLTVAASKTPWQLSDTLVFALLVSLAVIFMEASRRLGEPAGFARDLTAAWWLPMALLLPPVYVMLAPVPLNAVTQWHIHPSPLHRRIFTTAATVLPYGLTSWMFHSLPWVTSPPGTGIDALVWAATLLGGGGLCTVINILVVAVAIRFASAETRWREVLWDKEKANLDTVEVCAGVCIAALCAANPVLAFVALPPLLMLQRSLMFSQLRSAARLDAKTGLLNAVTWEREAASELVRARRTGTPLAAMLLDLDLFKQVNDAYGHLVGDRMLRSVADALRAQLRDYDLVGRFGGEEFAVLLPQTDALQAQLAAERLRRCVASAGVPIDDEFTVTVTASIGVAMFARGEADVPDLLAAADAALYQAKRNGRNRVVIEQAHHWGVSGSPEGTAAPQ